MVLNLSILPDPPRARPKFQNVVTTGNVLSLAATATAMLPILTLVYELGSWSATIEARIASLQSSISTVADLEKSDQEQLTELKSEVHLMMLQPPPIPSIIRPSK
jgi:hypothetical protein